MLHELLRSLCVAEEEPVQVINIHYDSHKEFWTSLSIGDVVYDVSHLDDFIKSLVIEIPGPKRVTIIARWDSWTTIRVITGTEVFEWWNDKWRVLTNG